MILEHAPPLPVSMKLTKKGLNLVTRIKLVGNLLMFINVYFIGSQWFSDHPEYLANPFYIGGDSNAGKIVPFLGQMISEGID